MHTGLQACFKNLNAHARNCDSIFFFFFFKRAAEAAAAPCRAEHHLQEPEVVVRLAQTQSDRGACAPRPARRRIMAGAPASGAQRSSGRSRHAKLRQHRTRARRSSCLVFCACQRALMPAILRWHTRRCGSPRIVLEERSCTTRGPFHLRHRLHESALAARGRATVPANRKLLSPGDPFWGDRGDPPTVFQSGLFNRFIHSYFSRLSSPQSHSAFFNRFVQKHTS